MLNVNWGHKVLVNPHGGESNPGHKKKSECRKPVCTSGLLGNKLGSLTSYSFSSFLLQDS